MKFSFNTPALFLLAAICCLSLKPISAHAADIYVHHEQGDDKNPGSKAEMLKTAQRAVAIAQPGDVIHLLPEGAIYRQAVMLRGKSDLTIEGNNVTLEGADPLPETGWEEVSADLHRLKVPRTLWDRHLLVIDGKMERMGRSPTKSSVKFPAPEDLKSGQFRFELIPVEEGKEKEGWLYVKGSLKNLEWAVRPYGVATTGKNRNITIRNLNARHALNDGFNIHDDAMGLVFSHIQGYNCYDEGFSAHEACECFIDHGKFWGNDNAIADVNDCETHYVNCEFGDSVSYDVLLIGKTHSLTNCRIINTTSAVALSAGPRGPEKKLYQLKLEQVTIEGKTSSPAQVNVSAGQLRLKDNNFINTKLNIQGATLIEE